VQDYTTNIAIHGQSADLPKWVVLVRPDFGHIKNIPLVVFSILGIHDLNIDTPNRIVPAFDCVEQILQEKVWILSGHLLSFLAGEVLDTLLGFDMNLNVFERAILKKA